MTADQVTAIRKVAMTDDGSGHPMATSLRVVFNDGVAFRNTNDFVIFDDATELVSAIQNSQSGLRDNAESPYQISTGCYDSIQFMEGLYTMKNFSKAVDEMFVKTGLIDDAQRKMIMDWAKGVRHHSMVPQHPGPYYPEGPSIPHKPPVPECRPDGIDHQSPMGQHTKKNKIISKIQPLFDEMFESEKRTQFCIHGSVTEVTPIVDFLQKVVDAMGDDLQFISFTDSVTAAVYKPSDRKSSADLFIENATKLMPVEKNVVRHYTLYVEAYGVRVRYDIYVKLVTDMDAVKAWEEDTIEAISSFIAGIDNDDIIVKIVGSRTIDATISSVNNLDVGFVEAMLETPGVTGVTVRIGANSYSMRVGSESTYESFKKGVISAMPNENGASVSGAVEVKSADGNLRYTLRVKYLNQSEYPVAIGDKYYDTIGAAVAAATSGDTIVLQQDIVVSNSAVSGSPNTAVIMLPLGVSLDGNDHTIKANSWTTNSSAAYGTNHIVGLRGKGAKLSNVTIVGVAACKSGVVVSGDVTEAEIENVIISGCGNCGVQVSGAKCTATNLTTSDNAWGGVNVDVSKNVTPQFTLVSGNLAEPAKVYTEITDKDVVTVPDSFVDYIIYGEMGKGFRYFTTSDVINELCSATGIMGEATNVAFQQVTDIASAGDGDLRLYLIKNATGDLTVPAGFNLRIDGNDFVWTGSIELSAVGSSRNALALESVELNGGGSRVNAIRSVNNTDQNQIESIIALEKVRITNYTGEAISATNAKVLSLVGCEIECESATAKAIVDLNLQAVKDTLVDIDDCVFSGYGAEAAVRVAARGGPSDNGIPGISTIPATIEDVTIKSCVFAENANKYALLIGNETLVEGAQNTTADFGVNVRDVVNDTRVATAPTGNVVVVPTGRTGSKTATTEFALNMNAEEKADAIIENAEGIHVVADETQNNVYTLTVSNGSISGIFDQLAAMSDLASITVEDDKGNNASYVVTGVNDDANLAQFKAAVDGMIPKSNDAEEAVLTLVITMKDNA